jgi:hypothetical protein
LVCRSRTGWCAHRGQLLPATRSVCGGCRRCRSFCVSRHSASMADGGIARLARLRVLWRIPPPSLRAQARGMESHGAVVFVSLCSPGSPVSPMVSRHHGRLYGAGIGTMTQLLRRNLAVGAFIGAALLFSTLRYVSSVRRTPAGQQSLVQLNRQLLPIFREDFNRSADRTRLLVLMSPT